MPQRHPPPVPVRPYAIIASVFNLTEHLEEFTESSTLPRSRVAHQRRLDRQHRDAAAAGGLALLRRWRQSAKARGIGSCSNGCHGTSRPSWSSIPTSASVDSASGSSADLEHFVGDFQQSGAAARVPASHDRAGRISRPLSVVRIRARVPGRAEEAWRTTASLRVAYRYTAASALCARTARAFVLRIRGGPGERRDFPRPWRAHLLRWPTGGEHGGTRDLRRWFSQRVGWYHGLLKVYTERLGEIWSISRRTPFATYHYRLCRRAVAGAASGEGGQRDGASCSAC